MPNTQRQSGDLLVLRVPRPDFPQFGWIRKPTVNGTTGDFYEALTGFGWYGLTQSYRPYERLIRYGTNAHPFRCWYDSQPQQGWMAKPVLTGGTALYEARTGYGWYPETQAYRGYEKLIQYGPRPSALRVWYESKVNVFNPNLFDLDDRWPAIAQDSTLPRMNTRLYPQVLTQTTINVFNANLFDLDDRWPAIAQDTNIPRMAPKTRIQPAYIMRPEDVFNPNLFDLDDRAPAWMQDVNIQRMTQSQQGMYATPFQVVVQTGGVTPPVVLRRRRFAKGWTNY